MFQKSVPARLVDAPLVPRLAERLAREARCEHVMRGNVDRCAVGEFGDVAGDPAAVPLELGAPVAVVDRSGERVDLGRQQATPASGGERRVEAADPGEEVDEVEAGDLAIVPTPPDVPSTDPAHLKHYSSVHAMAAPMGRDRMTSESLDDQVSLRGLESLRLDEHLRDDRGLTDDTLGIWSAVGEILYWGPTSPTGATATTGLALGYVQSGKTTAITALIAASADSGYRVIVAILGSTNLLLEQNDDRLSRALGIGTRTDYRWVRMVNPSTAKHATSSRTGSPVGAAC